MNPDYNFITSLFNISPESIDSLKSFIGAKRINLIRSFIGSGLLFGAQDVGILDNLWIKQFYFAPGTSFFTETYSVSLSEAQYASYFASAMALASASSSRYSSSFPALRAFFISL